MKYSFMECSFMEEMKKDETLVEEINDSTNCGELMKSIEDEDSKRRKVKIGKTLKVLAIVLFILAGFGWLYYHYTYDQLDLKKDVFVYEFGEKVNLDINQFLEGKYNQSLLKTVKLETPLKTIKGKNYPPVGEYPSRLIRGKETKELTIKVQDTVAPKWIAKPDKIIIEQNAENVTLIDYFKAEDLSKVMIGIGQSNFDIKKVGNYDALVIASDESFNTATHKVKIEVVSTKDSNKKKVTKTISGNIPESAKKRKEREIQKAKKSSTSAGNKPKASTLTNTSISNVSSGRSIKLNKPTGYTPPAILPQGDLTDRQFKILKSFYDDYVIPLRQTDFTITLASTYTEEDVINAMKHLNDVLGSHISYKITHEKDKSGEQNLNVKVFFSDFVSQHLNQERKDLAYNACIKAGLKDGMSERSAVKKINDWIINHMTYKINNGDADVGFKTGLGQCHTYAQMFDEMCDIVNISCTYESGYADGAGGWGSHAWNKVKISNTWYYIDTTWNDSRPRNRYYLSKTLWSDHKAK